MAQVQMNGSAFHHQNHESSLEDSISSLLSQSLSVNTSQYKTITTSYKKSAKLFINKKFVESYTIVKDLVQQSVDLRNDGVITETDFVNVWSLYFNLIDIFLNKAIVTLSKSERDELVAKFQSDELWNILYDQLDQIVDPKLIVLLVLIKLNNESDTDLQRLRQHIDLYLVNFTSLYHVDDLETIDHEKFESFQELLEIYHIYLLPRLDEYEESEYLIGTNPYIKNPEEMIQKVHQAKIDLEEKRRRQKELAEKRAQEAKRRKEQEQREEEQFRKQKELEKAKREMIKTQKENRKREKKEKTLTNTNDFSVLEIIKKRFLKTQLANTNVLVVIFSLISLLLLAKNHRLILNAKIRRFLANFWLKFTSTLKMAFQVTYM